MNDQTEMFDIPIRIITVLDKGFKKTKSLSQKIKISGDIRKVNQSHIQIRIVNKFNTNIRKVNRSNTNIRKVNRSNTYII